MATIIVEDGTGKTNSNSYGDEAGLATYAADRGVTLSGTPAVLLIQAMDFMEQQLYRGVKNTSSQALQWPRYGVVLDGYYFDNDAIPQLLVEAQYEVCISIDTGVDPLSTLGRTTKREQVGNISVEYADGSSPADNIRRISAKLDKLLAMSGMINGWLYRV